MKLINKIYDKIKKERESYIFKHIKVKENILILGGRDPFVNKIIKCTHNKLRYHIVDLEESNLKKSNIIIKCSDLNQEIPFHDNYFDCIIADQIIEHLYNTDLFLKEIKRVSKNRCLLLIGSENLASWHNIISLIMSFQPFSADYSDTVKVGNPLSPHYLKKIIPYMSHIRVPTIKAIVDLLKLNGFRISETVGFGHLLPFGTLFDKYHSLFFVISCEAIK